MSTKRVPELTIPPETAWTNLLECRMMMRELKYRLRTLDAANNLEKFGPHIAAVRSLLIAQEGRFLFWHKVIESGFHAAATYVEAEEQKLRDILAEDDKVE